MYYLLIAAAAGMSVPADNSPLATIDVTSAPSSGLTAYDTRRIQYKARNWEGELRSDVDVYFGTFDSEEACRPSAPRSAPPSATRKTRPAPAASSRARAQGPPTADLPTPPIGT